MDGIDMMRLMGVLRRALREMKANSCRVRLSTYRIMVVLASVDGPLSAYAVARRCGFPLESGRVLLHLAQVSGMVERVRTDDGVVWRLSTAGGEELGRLVGVALAQDEEEARSVLPCPAPAPVRRVARRGGRR